MSTSGSINTNNWNSCKPAPGNDELGGTSNNNEGPLVVRGTTTDEGKPSTTQGATDSDNECKE
ncbi:hypothetical protein L208DRAFT_1395409 [Tricholoma matsutake]|nr:hypothetical protein L208DRAFT_1395409 [Tricholoma matsutake 945]